MDRTAADNVTKALLANMHHKLAEAAAIAKAAEVIAESGNVRAALKTVMDVEDHMHQAGRLLNAVLLLDQQD
jgi:hypothetical protein